AKCRRVEMSGPEHARRGGGASASASVPVPVPVNANRFRGPVTGQAAGPVCLSWFIAHAERVLTSVARASGVRGPWPVARASGPMGSFFSFCVGSGDGRQREKRSQ
ncbi:hypothetical protein E4U53_001353, partial [Claviceps sorghi]